MMLSCYQIIKYCIKHLEKIKYTQSPQVFWFLSVVKNEDSTRCVIFVYLKFILTSRHFSLQCRPQFLLTHYEMDLSHNDIKHKRSDIMQLVKLIYVAQREFFSGENFHHIFIHIGFHCADH